MKVFFLIFAIFALAEALPYHDDYHTLDGWGGPEKSLGGPTGDLDRVERQGSFCLGVVKKCAGFTTSATAWTGNFTRVDMFGVDDFLHEQIANCPKVKTESKKQKLKLYNTGNGSMKRVWVPQMLPQTCERLKKIREAYPVYTKKGNGLVSVAKIRQVINYYGGELSDKENNRMIRDFSKFEGQVPKNQDPNMVRYHQDPIMVPYEDPNMEPNYHQDPFNPNWHDL